MPDFPSPSALFRVGRDEVLIREARISREAVERAGMDANILVASGSAMADEVVRLIAELAAAIFLDSAKRAALDHLVFDRYGLTRKPASASLGSVEFSTTAPSPTTFTIPSGTLVQTASGIQFATIEDAIFSVGTTGPLVVAVRSVLAGADQDVKIGVITSIISQIASSPTDLVVINTLATAGGDDEESDDLLRERGRRFFVTARRGTLAALEAAALNAAGVRTATAIEVIDVQGRPARLVQLVVADGFTEQFIEFDTVPPRFQTQSQMLTQAVQTAIDDVRAAGIFVQVTVANTILQPVQLALTFLAGVDVNAVALNARASIVQVINSLSPGKPIEVADLQDALRTVTGLLFTGQEIVSPPGDVSAKPLQLLRTSLGLVSAVSAQTDTPLATGTNPDAFVAA